VISDLLKEKKMRNVEFVFEFYFSRESNRSLSHSAASLPNSSQQPNDIFQRHRGWEDSNQRGDGHDRWQIMERYHEEDEKLKRRRRRAAGGCS
jgi:hypothetical protein